MELLICNWFLKNTLMMRTITRCYKWTIYCLVSRPVLLSYRCSNKLERQDQKYKFEKIYKWCLDDRNVFNRPNFNLFLENTPFPEKRRRSTTFYKTTLLQYNKVTNRLVLGLFSSIRANTTTSLCTRPIKSSFFDKNRSYNDPNFE